MLVVADATPLISLMKIGRLNLLERLFGQIVVPEASAWAVIHKEELAANWVLAETKETLYKIEPLR